MKRNLVLLVFSGILVLLVGACFAQENNTMSEFPEEQLTMQIQQALVNGDEQTAENLRVQLKQAHDAAVVQRQQDMQSMQQLAQDAKDGKLETRKTSPQADFKSAMDRYNEADARQKKHQQQAMDQMKMIDDLDHQQEKK